MSSCRRDAGDQHTQYRGGHADHYDDGQQLPVFPLGHVGLPVGHLFSQPGDVGLVFLLVGFHGLPQHGDVSRQFMILLFQLPEPLFLILIVNFRQCSYPIRLMPGFSSRFDGLAQLVLHRLSLLHQCPVVLGGIGLAGDQPIQPIHLEDQLADPHLPAASLPAFLPGLAHDLASLGFIGLDRELEMRDPPGDLVLSEADPELGVVRDALAGPAPRKRDR